MATNRSRARHPRTARLNGEKAGKGRGSRFRLLAERTPDVVYRVRLRPAVVIEYVSPAAGRLTGFSPEEFYADPDLWTRLVHPDDRALVEAISSGADPEAPIVARWVRRDGSILWAEDRRVPVFGADGALDAIEGAARDITSRVEAELRLAASEARFRSLLAEIDLGALMLDTSGSVEFINDYLLALLGRTREEMLGQDWIEMAVPERERSALREAFEAAIAARRGTGRREDGIVTRSGEVRRLLWTSAILLDLSGKVAGLAGLAYDVTEVRRGEAERDRLVAAVEQSAESVIITDRHAQILYVNKAFERYSGYSREEIIGRNPRILKSGLQSPTFYDAMWAALTSGLPWIADVVNRRKDGSLYSVSSVTSPIRSSAGTITGFVDVGRDVSHERELESRAELLTRERALIGETLRRLPAGGDLETTAELFCRQVASLTDIVVAALIIFESDRAAVPLAFVGPRAREVGLQRHTPERSHYLIDHATSGPWVEEWVDDSTHPYADSFRQAGVRAFAYAPVSAEGSVIGVLAIGSAEADAIAQLSGQLGALVDFGDLAGALLGDRVDDRREDRRFRAEVERVIADRTFSSVFQPIVDIRSGRVVGHEALTRFSDGVRPDLRFADAEAAGLGLELEAATLGAAVAAASGVLSPSRWLHLNVSPEFVMAGRELGRLLHAAPFRIVLEVTEHEAVGDYAAFREAIAALGRPIRVAVDDAGAGFASLRHILELEPAFVKLDISLVRGIDIDPAKQALVAGMRHFARTTGRRLIAEGVETQSEAATLQNLDIRLAQGNLFGRPVTLR